MTSRPQKADRPYEESTSRRPDLQRELSNRKIEVCCSRPDRERRPGALAAVVTIRTPSAGPVLARRSRTERGTHTKLVAADVVDDIDFVTNDFV
jgi:hypothetical protein